MTSLLARFRPQTLRVKLVVGLVLLIAVVCTAIGITTNVLVGSYLHDQLVGQLLQSQARSMAQARGERRQGPPPWLTAACAGAPRAASAGPDFLFRPGQQAGTLGALVSNDEVASAGILGQDICQVLPVRNQAALLRIPADGTVQPVHIDGQGDYLVVAGNTPVGTVLTGLPLAPIRAVASRLATISGLLAGIAVLVGGLVVYWIVRRSLRPLDRVAAAAHSVAALPLDRGAVELGPMVDAADTDTGTEVGQVGAALNQLLGHVSHALDARHQSEVRIRQFVADASHELRTPLTAIRGYAELARRDPTTVTHALYRVEAESARMSALVDDLLLLARLDSGRPLAHEQVDLTPVVVDAISDARVAGPEHHWRLNLPEEPTLVTGDRARLHQVIANLLTNARMHTPVGTTVTATLLAEDQGATVVVADDGPGIPQELVPEVFERFARGDSSRSRAAGSTGLGLAIVAAVVSAHGGRVSVTSRPGATLFRVWLPAAHPGDAGQGREPGEPEQHRPPPGGPTQRQPSPVQEAHNRA